VVKALHRARAEESIYPQIVTCVKGVVFLNTPQQQSSKVLWPNLLMRVLRANIQTNSNSENFYSDLCRRIERNAEGLQEVPARFEAEAAKIKVFSFFAELPTPWQKERVGFSLHLQILNAKINAECGEIPREAWTSGCKDYNDVWL
jgi:hypothetical protein